MKPLRLLAALALLLAAGFCAFGFFASFESPAYTAWRIGYAAAGLAALAGSAALAWSALRR